MENLLKRLIADYPDIDFVSGDQFCWSPVENKVMYDPGKNSSDFAWALIHELSHALLDHKAYDSDLELLLLEVAAWDKAKDIANSYDLLIDEDHIQDCLDTYRDWLYQRSKCPVCDNNGLQQSPESYRCFNCRSNWRVSNSRFCRPYRQLNRSKNKTSPEQEAQAMFI